MLKIKVRGFNLEEGSPPKVNQVNQGNQGSPWNRNTTTDLLAPAPMSLGKSDLGFPVKKNGFMDLMDDFQRSSSPPLLSINKSPNTTLELQQVFKEEILRGEWNGTNDDHSTVMAASVISSALLENDFKDVPPRAFSTPPTRMNTLPDITNELKNLQVGNVFTLY